jgi:Tfp pilus assembly protein PilF
MIHPRDSATELGLQANQLFASGQFQEAIDLYQKALLIQPNFSAIEFNCALAYQAIQDHPHALDYYDQAIMHQPDYADAYINRGNVLRDLQQLELARQSYERALQLAPQMVQAWINLGVVLYEQRKIDQACIAFEKALSDDPKHANARWGLSLCHLLLGQYQQGWQEFECRLKDQHFIQQTFPKEFAEFLWKKGTSIQGKTILLMAEQGLGDTIQFCRFAKNIQQLGARVILQVPEVLQQLLTGMEGIDQVLSDKEQAREVDVVIPLMSLPYQLDLQEKDYARDVYLRADPQKLTQWQPIIEDSKPFKIGLVWQGGVRESMPHTWATHQRRNIPLEFFAQLQRPDITFYHLQKGSHAIEELEDFRKDHSQADFHIKDLAFDDFTDTAAIISYLDVVITVDTSVAHLAGAMGKPVWILNRFDGCWRWRLNQSDTLWYPSMKLYFQPSPGDWQSVIDDVIRDLNELISART